MAAVANAIRVNFQVNVLNGSYRESINPGSLGITQQSAGRGGGIQTVSHTAAGVLSLGSLTTNGWAYLQNLDAANYMTFGPQSGGAMVAMGKLLAGEFAWVRLAPGVVLMAEADTADVQVDVRAFQN